jgi:hypothetical protein
VEYGRRAGQSGACDDALVPDGVFNETDAGLAFALLPPPTGRDLLAILDRVIRRVAQRLGLSRQSGRSACGGHSGDAPSRGSVVPRISRAADQPRCGAPAQRLCLEVSCGFSQARLHRGIDRHCDRSLQEPACKLTSNRESRSRREWIR